jgi:hypothetical protein
MQMLARESYSNYAIYWLQENPNKMFDIPVRIESIERRKKSVSMFHILAGLFLAANAGLITKKLDNNWLWAVVPIYLVSVFSLIFAIRLKKVNNPVRINRWMRLLQVLALFISGIILVNHGSFISSLILFVWTGICLMLYLMEQSVFSKPVLKITETNLQVPSLFSSKKVNWKLVESVAIRQDFITINYTNNRYLQLEVVDQLTGTEIEQIRSFCNQKAVEQIDPERQEIGLE